MIQRIQTVYLAIVIILLSIVTIGTTFFSFVNKTGRYEFTSFGIIEREVSTNAFVGTQTFPLFVGLIALILLTFLTLMSYKNLKRQYKLGRMVFGLYFVLVVTLFILSIYGSKLLPEATTSREMGLGFLLTIIGFPFSFLANTGIKRDKNLIDSLDRLR